ncbi:UNVERIFIED_ORG: dihydrolipoamide dehydrogenase [Burkholderia sp. CF145]|uniref:dihydrolipoyl dehydrogenase n=1 Tax=Paraburkholderia hospita TaxID=169430 RepID=UPI0002717A25|nr:dihydrolipoyl dehydrogenase [Paraburkholderia hospita]EUC12940.1 dihydrolipoamide dehydrogenase [Burkholderia sp. BT03]SKC73054.1 dihydrolipoamide dehydrogenase [Paraburkholderia hospita]
MDHFDVVIIGCGAGGYNTAIRAGQLGLSVACIERASRPGGMGIRTGCIPSRVLLRSSEIYDLMDKGSFTALGIGCAPTLDLAQMMAHKKAIVDKMSTRVHSLLHKQGVTLIHGHAKLAAAGQVEIRNAEGARRTVRGASIVIATGSEPIPLPFAAFDHVKILDSEDALSLDRVPRHLAIIGAGAVGVEVGSIWRRLGSRVTLIEQRDRICCWCDRDVTAALERSLKQQGIAIRLCSDVIGVDKRASGVSIQLRTATSSTITTVDADAVLVAIGRRPSTGGLNLAGIGVQAGAQGALLQQAFAQRGPAIWAVGDAAVGPMLISKAEEEAVACAERIAGLPGFVDYSSIPYVLYTRPEVAMIGKTVDELVRVGAPYKVGYFPLATNARAAIDGIAEGFVKLLVEARTNRIAGAHLIGPGAADLISQVAIAMEASMLCEDFAHICHPFPAWSEALRQAAMAAGGWATHI